MIGAQWLIKRRVDFDGVEELGKVSDLVEILRPAGRINITTPIAVRPAGGTDTDTALRLRFGG
jgi:hypothetical protein